MGFEAQHQESTAEMYAEFQLSVCFLYRTALAGHGLITFMVVMDMMYAQSNRTVAI